MSIQIFHERSVKLTADAQQIMLNLPSDPVLAKEQRAKVDLMLAEADTLDADIARLQRAAKHDNEDRSALTIPRGNPGDSAAANLAPEVRTRLEQDMFDYTLRGSIPQLRINSATRDRWNAALEKRDILEAGTGSNFVPQAFYPVLSQALKAWGDLLNIVDNVRSDNGAPMKYATSDATEMEFFEETVGTADANSPQTPNISGAVINTSLLSLPPIKVGWDELQDSAFDITAFLRDVLGMAYFRSLSKLCVNGSPSGNIASILTGVGTAGFNVSTAVASVVTYVDIANLYGLLDPGYIETSTFTMNSTTRASLLGEVNTLGNPIFTPSASVTADPFGSLLGRPVKLVQALPNIGAGAFPILLGDFMKGYKLRTVNPGLGINIVRELFAAQFETGFIPFARNGSAFIAPGGTQAIVGLKVTAPTT